MSMNFGRNPTPGNLSTGAGNYFGGPRGFAAGVTSVLVNFLLNYEKGNVEQLKKDIAEVQAQVAKHSTQQQAALDRQKSLQNQLLQAEQGRAKLQTTEGTSRERLLGLLNDQLKLQKTGLSLDAERTKQLDSALARQVRYGTLTAEQAAALRQEYALTQQVAAAQADVNAGKQEEIVLTERQNILQRLQGALSAGGSRLGALGVGLIAGTIGGALVSSAIIKPIQDALAIVGKGLTSIIDPSSLAKDALSGVNQQLDALAKNRNLSGPEAIVELLKSYHLATTDSNTGVLGQAHTLELSQKYSDNLKQINDYLAGGADLWNKTGTQILYSQGALDKFNEKLHASNGFAGDLEGGLFRALHESGLDQIVSIISKLQGGPTVDELLGINASTIASANNEAAAIQRAADSAKALTDYIQNINQQSVDAAVQRANDYQVNTANAALATFIAHAKAVAQANIDLINQTYDKTIINVQNQATAQIDALQKKLQNLQLTPSARTTNLEAQLKALSNAGPSKQTQELTDKINDFTKAQADATYQSQLAAIAEQKRQLLLTESLNKTGAVINLEKYAGKDRLIAIDALLKKMQDQNAEQARFNKLLDIQYQINQGLHRQQNETIQDFIARRAQYYRGLLQQAADLRTQGPRAELEAERQRVTDSIALKDLETKRRQLIDAHAQQIYLQGLQDQLAASKAKDAAELQSRRDSLQKQLAASQKADQDALNHQKQALQDQITAIKKNEADRITALNTSRDKAIAAENATRDAAIADAQAITAKIIAELQIRADQTKQWTNYANQQQLDQMILATQNMAQLQSLAGNVAGLEWSMNFLYRTGALMGMDPAAAAALIKNYIQVLHDYQGQVTQFYRPLSAPKGTAVGLAEGGLFMLGNHNTPVMGDVRWGDGNGPEIGMNIDGKWGAVLSNKVVQTLRDQAGSRQMMGDVSFVSQDPWRDRNRFERMVRDVVRDEVVKH